MPRKSERLPRLISVSRLQQGWTSARDRALFLWSRVALHPRVTYLLRIYSRYTSHRVGEQAAVISFWTLFSIAPLLLFAFSVLGLLVSPERLQAQIEDYVRLLVPEQVILVRSLLAMLPGSTLGVSVGTLGLLWSGARLFTAVLSGLNRAHGASDRGFLKRRLVSLAAVMVLTLLAALIFVATSAGALLSRIPLPQVPVIWPTLLSGQVSYLWTFGLIFGALVVAYWLLPNQDLSWRDSWQGALVATVLLLVLRYSFGLYLRTQDLTIYGTLGGVIVFLVFVYFAAQVFLLGAEINAEGLAQPRREAVSQVLSPPGQ